MAITPKLPPTSDVDFTSPAWQRFFRDSLMRLVGAGQILWTQVTKAGSNLTDLATRNHADLQNINTASYTHLTATNHTDLTDGGDTTLHKHSSAWPVGAVFISVVSTNPATLLGFGTWSAFGAGRVLVGIDSGQTEFDTVEETGGAKTHTLTAAESGTTAHIHSGLNVGGVAIEWVANAGGGVGARITAASGAPVRVNAATPASASSAHNNLQPYIVVYMWKRTA